MRLPTGKYSPLELIRMKRAIGQLGYLDTSSQDKSAESPICSAGSLMNNYFSGAHSHQSRFIQWGIAIQLESQPSGRPPEARVRRWGNNGCPRCIANRCSTCPRSPGNALPVSRILFFMLFVGKSGMFLVANLEFLGQFRSMGEEWKINALCDPM
jgi:hypothetical protein